MMYNKYTERMFAERVFFEFILIIYEYISECINIFKYKDLKKHSSNNNEDKMV